MRLLGPQSCSQLQALPNCNLKAMCDLSEARLKHMRSLYPEVEAVTDFKALAH